MVLFMKLLFISHLFPNSVKPTRGVFFLEKCRALVDVGVEVKVVVPVPYVPFFMSYLKSSWAGYYAIGKAANIYGIEVYYKRYLLLPGKWFLNLEGLFMFWGVRSFLKKFKSIYDYDAVLGGMLTNDGWAALEMAKCVDVPSLSFVIGSDINVYPKFSSSIYRLTYNILNKLDAVISVGDAFSDVVREKFPHLDKDIVWNSIGIDLDKFCPLSAIGKSYFRERYAIDKGDVVCLYVGRLQEMKGIRDLMEALLSISDMPFRLFLVGDGDLSSWVHDFVIENHLTGKCVLVGDVDHELLPDIFRGADLFVFPSYAEGSPNVLIEAAASGLPILASNIHTNKDVLKNDVNGFEFKVGDPADLARKLSVLIENKYLRESFARESRLVAENGYDRIDKAKELKKVISTLVC